ncbi:MAG: Bifunctional IPC transferase and DIPP synthase [Candidatus Argoarchaeum ethanivorans]|uniref:Bifunctional IPC transferase and DIPP synthase n=1 Tax=Candidatus Argoarchaeum ethanivorans TaxID=2608793 RepID=A0A811T8U5_9EURY|nr:MAG: Bifunctional IPC transferase and DIPP synthase [Candidatus Argoarchaeum ethanivorans]
MKCLIIAAGLGSRLSKKGDSKPLVSLLGLSLIERVILTAKKSGLTSFYVVTGYNGEKVRQHLNQFKKDRNIEITHIINEEWEKGNGISVLKAEKLLNENFILLMGDHIFDESILVKLKDEEITDSEVVLTVDHNIETNKLVDANDVTRVREEDEKILDIGKNIKKYNAYDTGIFLCSPAIFGALEESLRSGDSTLSGGVKVLANRGKAKTFDIKDCYWIDVDNEGALKKAENKLLDTLKKTSDGPVSRHLNRPISTKISKCLVKTSVTPNVISFLSFILCCIGAFFFFLGGWVNLAIGATLAQVSSIVDGCDGEVARLKFNETEFGAWFDAVLDRYADAFLLFGLTCYVYFLSEALLCLAVGFLAIIGTFMNSYTADKYDGLMKKKIGLKGHYFRMGRDVRIFIIFLFALLNMRFLFHVEIIDLPLLAILLIAILMNTENIRRVVVLYKNRQC